LEMGIDTAMSHELSGAASVVKKEFFRKASIVAVVMLNGNANAAGVGFERFLGSKRAGTIGGSLRDHESETGEVIDKDGHAPVAFVGRFAFDLGDQPRCGTLQLVNGDAGPWLSGGFQFRRALFAAPGAESSFGKKAGGAFGKATTSQSVRNEVIASHLPKLLKGMWPSL
jgi:hypothetical protein